ncbi:MAG: septum formation family protein [Acidimicrobiia bacterium]
MTGRCLDVSPVLRVLVLALVVAGCSVPSFDLAAPAPEPPKIVHDVDLADHRVCDYGYCGESRIAAAAGIDADRYAGISVAPISQTAARRLAADLAARFPGVDPPVVDVESSGCDAYEACVTGEYEGGRITLFEPTLGTLLHEVAHHIAEGGDYRRHDIRVADFGAHSDGFEWALLDVYLAYLALPIDHVLAETGPSAEPTEFVVGACVDLAGADGVVDRVDVVDCAEPHYGEVYLAEVLAGIDYPGDDELADRADGRCLAAFADYVGEPHRTSAYGFDWLLPSEAGWRSGDRELVCLVVDGDGNPLVGSVRD